MEQEIHIAGLVVYAQPDQIDPVRRSIGCIPSAEIHAASADGKLVITLETDSAKRTLDLMDALRVLPGVVNVALVYQHAEPLAALEQEIPS
jgi:periplasmic nitrate reductase NapD